MSSLGEVLWVGLDVGSTTVKIAVVQPRTRELLHWDYQRHHADQAGVVAKLLGQVHQQFPGNEFRVAVCGSAGEPFAKVTGAFFIQEVVANAIAIKDRYTNGFLFGEEADGHEEQKEKGEVSFCAH